MRSFLLLKNKTKFVYLTIVCLFFYFSLKKRAYPPAGGLLCSYRHTAQCFLREKSRVFKKKIIRVLKKQK
jgi:hypothetical protein